MGKLARRTRNSTEAAYADSDAAAGALDDEAVLRHLETELPDEGDDRALRGIRNAVLIGALAWLILIGLFLVV